MIFIIIGIVIFVAGILVMVKFNNPIVLLIGVIPVFMLPLLGISDISGYEEPVLKQEYDLKPIYEPNVYVIEDSDGSVTCKHVIKNQHPEAIESYGKYTYSENVEVVITEKGSKPVMKKYHIKAKQTIWTFAVNCDKTKYVFYVPEGNIERWQNEHVN